MLQVISVTISRLIASISGGDRSVAYNSSVVFDASQSYDPELLGADDRPADFATVPSANQFLTFSWTCALKDGDPCRLAAGGLVAQPCLGGIGIGAAICKIDLSQLNVLGQDTLLVSVRVTKGSRSAAATVILALAPVQMLDISIGVLYSGPGGAAYVAVGTAATAPQAAISFSWALVGPVGIEGSRALDLNDSRVFPAGAVSAVFVLDRRKAPLGAASGLTYQLILSAVAINSTGLSGQAVLNLQAPPAPWGGECNASPVVGAALHEAFMIKCKEWVPAKAPLSYYYAVTDPNTTQPTPAATGWSPCSPAPSYSLRLPPGIHRLYVAIVDGEGASIVVEAGIVNATLSAADAAPPSVGIGRVGLASLAAVLTELARLDFIPQLLLLCGAYLADLGKDASACNSLTCLRTLPVSELTAVAYRMQALGLVLAILAGSAAPGLKEEGLAVPTVEVLSFAGRQAFEMNATTTRLALAVLTACGPRLTSAELRSGGLKSLHSAATSVLAAASQQFEIPEWLDSIKSVFSVLGEDGIDYALGMVEGESGPNFSGGNGPVQLSIAVLSHGRPHSPGGMTVDIFFTPTTGHGPLVAVCVLRHEPVPAFGGGGIFSEVVAVRALDRPWAPAFPSRSLRRASSTPWNCGAGHGQCLSFEVQVQLGNQSTSLGHDASVLVGQATCYSLDYSPGRCSVEGALLSGPSSGEASINASVICRCDTEGVYLVSLHPLPAEPAAPGNAPEVLLVSKKPFVLGSVAMCVAIIWVFAWVAFWLALSWEWYVFHPAKEAAIKHISFGNHCWDVFVLHAGDGDDRTPRFVRRRFVSFKEADGSGGGSVEIKISGRAPWSAVPTRRVGISSDWLGSAWPTSASNFDQRKVWQ